MCAIFGILGEHDEKKAKDALALLSHRGGDFCGITQGQNLFFAHHKLSITGTNSDSNQPFSYEKILLSFNGEIYNYKELRADLSCEFNFKTQSEAEVIAASYLKWGVNFVLHLRGMFAIALLDDEILYLFRDRLGKKPLFYLHVNAFIFASEIKALVPFLHSIEMDEDALLSYLSFLAPTPPFTFFKNIKKLAAGEYLIFKDSKVEIKRYFDLLDTTPSLITNRDEAVFLVQNALEEAINIRLATDVPMASLLSGGIDSAAINAYAKKASMDIQTYTLGYKEFAKYDERQNASLSASLLGVKNRAVEISQREFDESCDIVLDALDEPLNDPAAVPLYLLFGHIKKDGYKVVLSGEGSDELFLGYRQYFEFLDIEKLTNLKNKNWLSGYFHSNFSMNREWERYKRVFDGSLLFRTTGENFTDLQKNVSMKRNVRDNESLKYIQNYRETFLASSHSDESIWYSYIDLHLFQAEHYLTKLDRLSMAHSIESRTPFLDHKLASLVFSIDPKIRYMDGVTKSLLKSALKPMLDEKILSRRKKGFSNPFMEYLIESKKISLIKEVNEKTGIFKKEILDEHIKKAANGGFKQHIWGLYVLSVWLKKYLL
ncbi:Asparagine synthase, glutamine-hydrolyzing [Sulfurimonas denitrificans DSM 1251]|uniref:asparagine synthase (glutamine-hydrolyzing) n=1 Tax=Sulfurimonas denitrificans (strain ATCC 33889 / DSM 1251) TaxID=326298 RepID=Q30U87_SULDN|nr:asparagine synthase (glutamine-hydrolyzing) [Sulfurimonas denitrificans]ABB43444.1 Asparagine synthase, glutamine-hydrolyzing [Sulfurimonas denitrificans DSM 1251]MDD3442916.1 asparagine synthase (glutamine-hydrolyzing) [Sulfurimonas denitrificans]